MIAIDTNVLLRYLARDHKEQTAKADRIIEHETEILITDVVLAETLWALKGPTYRASKSRLIAIVEFLLHDLIFRFEDYDVVLRALWVFRTHDADFADALIVQKALRVASKHDGLKAVFTFDKAALNIPYTAKP